MNIEIDSYRQFRSNSLKLCFVPFVWLSTLSYIDLAQSFLFSTTHPQTIVQRNTHQRNVGWIQDANIKNFPSPSSSVSTTTTIINNNKNMCLFGGMGIANDYKWIEEQFEIEITVTVPAGTKGKDIYFQSSPDSIDLKLCIDKTDSNSDGKDGNTVVLLDGSRKMRGKLNMDGTFWSIVDGDGENSNHRLVTVTIEKYKAMNQNEDMFGSSIGGEDEDWGGVYPNDDEEVIERKYKEAEEMDIREYAKTLGVDIDNLNMSLVDKSMFSVANMTKDTMEDLQKGGYVKEVTQQGGQEYEEKFGEVKPFTSPLGNMIAKDDIESGQVKIPFIDDDPIVKDLSKDTQSQPPVPSIDDQNQLTSKESIQKIEKKESNEQETVSQNVDVDPLEQLTVVKLKEILREQKLKVSGTKQELKDRLRAHVNSLLDNMQDSVELPIIEDDNDSA